MVCAVGWQQGTLGAGALYTQLMVENAPMRICVRCLPGSPGESEYNLEVDLVFCFNFDLNEYSVTVSRGFA